MACTHLHVRFIQREGFIGILDGRSEVLDFQVRKCAVA